MATELPLSRWKIPDVPIQFETSAASNLFLVPHIPDGSRECASPDCELPSSTTDSLSPFRSFLNLRGIILFFVRSVSKLSEAEMFVHSFALFLHKCGHRCVLVTTNGDSASEVYSGQVYIAHENDGHILFPASCRAWDLRDVRLVFDYTGCELKAATQESLQYARFVRLRFTTSHIDDCLPAGYHNLASVGAKVYIDSTVRYEWHVKIPIVPHLAIEMPVMDTISTVPKLDWDLQQRILVFGHSNLKEREAMIAGFERLRSRMSVIRARRLCLVIADDDVSESQSFVSVPNTYASIVRQAKVATICILAAVDAPMGLLALELMCRGHIVLFSEQSGLGELVFTLDRDAFDFLSFKLVRFPALSVDCEQLATMLQKVLDDDVNFALCASKTRAFVHAFATLSPLSDSQRYADELGTMIPMRAGSRFADQPPDLVLSADSEVDERATLAFRISSLYNHRLGILFVNNTALSFSLRNTPIQAREQVLPQALFPHTSDFLWLASKSHGIRDSLTWVCTSDQSKFEVQFHVSDTLLEDKGPSVGVSLHHTTGKTASLPCDHMDNHRHPVASITAASLKITRQVHFLDENNSIYVIITIDSRDLQLSVPTPAAVSQVSARRRSSSC
eukprot:TRINITY_DN15684_c0_g1_i1.p1 TRINITY_DN15684_c0_g1~~TRINITY_DN15684_c0_g1_i1.p1  ORF type:complete len:620 (-),score=55.26 TRINITY_DN15684_c0_g1_i1:67-1926(-)